MQSFTNLSFIILGLLSITSTSFAATCTISTYNEDDINNAAKNCDEVILDGINVPAGKTLTVNLKQGAKLIFQGTTTWGYEEWSGPLANVTGTDVEIFGAPGHMLDAKGNLWWDGKGEFGGKTKPVFFVLHGLTNAIIHDVNVTNTPFHCFWIEDSEGVIAQDIYVNSKDGRSLGKSTDGFNIWRSNNVTIERLTVYNQDDCVAVKSGTNVLIKHSYCSGGHGLSIGSVGGRDYNIVENVTVSDVQILNSVNGVRIKTVARATGAVTNVTYENIVLKDIVQYGIVAYANYNELSKSAESAEPYGGVPIKHFILKNVTGTVKETGTNVYVYVKNASDWQWSGVHVTGGEKIEECEGIPEDSGISCI